MIRLKCPKCATVLSLDDAEAGQVGKCTDCGDKFRVPAKKGAATGPAVKATSKAAAPAKRPRGDDDEEDQDTDETNKKKPKKDSKSKAKSPAAQSYMGLIITLVPCIILLGIGSIYINRLGMIVAGVSILLMLASGLMVYRTSMKENPTQAIMAGAFLVLAAASIGGLQMRDSIVEGKRNETRELIKKTPANQAVPKS